MIYWFIVLITIKHFIADVYLQTGEMSRGKRLGEWEGAEWHMLHALSHAIGTALVVGIIGSPLLWVICSGVSDFGFHIAIDSTKVRIEQKYEIMYKSRNWYWLTALDQAAHFTCYLIYGIILFI